MAQSSDSYHEPGELLSEETKDRHRAVVSLMEELEAVDWYQQRVDATQDEELKAILAHNRDEEKEHAVMVLEWLRRRDPKFHEELSQRLFTSGPIASHGHEHGHDSDETPEHGDESGGNGRSLGIGSLK